MTLPVKVLDSFALMAFLMDEPGAVAVNDLLLQAMRNEIQLLITVVNLGEVYYSIARGSSHAIAEQMIIQFLELSIETIPVDWEITRQATILKADIPIAYGDCFAAALAVQRDCPVVTGDPEFHRLEKQVNVDWI
jgi:ribonuclease VapC